MSKEVNKKISKKESIRKEVTKKLSKQTNKQTIYIAPKSTNEPQHITAPELVWGTMWLG